MNSVELGNLLTMREAAERVGLNYFSLGRLNGARQGPAVAVKLGANNLYRADDLDAWVLARKAPKST